MTAPRRICVVTGSRAEYGILYWLIREIEQDSDLRLQLVVTGMHLAPEFGLTYRAIEADGLHIDRKVEMLLASDTGYGVAKSVGLGVIGFADALADLRPDVVLLLGDRYEILAAAEAAFLCGVPLAHISGGEVTEGSLDDILRHSITKMSRYHFVAAEPYRRRVIQLGELPENVYTVGHPGLDNIARLQLLSREELSKALDFNLSGPLLLTTYHPVTTGVADPAEGMKPMLEALDAFPECRVLMTRPNADAGNRELNRMLDDYAAANPGRVRVVTSLGQLRYLSAMRHAAAVVGNSSSGLVEAPAMGKPTVNIGSRQKGRLKAASILDAEANRDAITSALRIALTPEMADRATRTDSPYGRPGASTRICEILKRVDLTPHLPKPFHDLA